MGNDKKRGIEQLVERVSEGVADRVGEFAHGLGQLVHNAAEGVENMLEDLTGKDPQYTYDYDVIAPVAMLAGLPWHNLPSTEWLVLVGIRSAEILVNSLIAKEQLSERPSEKDELAELDKEHPLADVFRDDGKQTSREDIETGVRRVVEDLSPREQFVWFEKLLGTLTEPPPTNKTIGALDDYKKLFQTIPLPPIAESFQLDATFANLRVAGPNPTSLFRVPDTGLPKKFPVTDAQYQSVLGEGDSLDAAASDGRLYMLDYAGQKPVLDGTFPKDQKYGFEPMALFAVPKVGADNRGLVPIAIQCGQDPKTHRVFTRGDEPGWLEAKTVVQVADGNYHELVAHLGRTHLLLEPFAVATPKLLAKDHPLRRLLDPHFEGTLFINWAAGAFLVAPENFVDRVLSGTIDADRVESVKGTAGRGFNDSFLPKWLAAQGLDDPKKLPVFPFRDDGLLIWEAIGEWTRDYVQVYWPDETAIREDEALQAWARNLSAFDGGRVAGFGDELGGKIVSPSYLAAAVQMIIWTASGMHAAVNFPQGNIMDFAPAAPLAGYSSGPDQSQPLRPKDWYKFLPPLDQALSQLNILFLLGNVWFTQLGQYGDGYFEQPKVASSLKRFQERLDEITAIIDRRNLSRPRYEYLLPKNIPQSINI